MSNNLWLNQSPFTDTRGGPNGGGGGYGEAIQYRGPLDAARANAGGRQGESEYPDGYLGSNLQSYKGSRRQDRLEVNVADRMNDRNYQRGVHRGGKMPMQEYRWPVDYGPQTRLIEQAHPGFDGDMLTVPRAVPVMDPEIYLRNGGRHGNLTDPEKERVYQRFGIQSTIGEEMVTPLKPAFAKEWLPPWGP